VKNVFGILMGITLNLWIVFDTKAMFIKLVLLIYEYGRTWDSHFLVLGFLLHDESRHILTNKKKIDSPIGFQHTTCNWL
jgi:hypothetical protein